jgi:hypothetical protein
MQTAFENWTNGRVVSTLGTNAGADKLPFQTWRHFKEAFAPELIARAVNESGRKVRSCIDPFGGSGTTALACQFLGVEPVTIEVNPYLADLIEAKLAPYDGGALNRDFGAILRKVNDFDQSHDLSYLPKTFVYPGVDSRWLFPFAVAQRIESYRKAISSLKNEFHQRFFRAILGGFVVDISNVFVNGKGRRYRQNWQEREHTVDQVDQIFCERVQSALREIVRYSNRPKQSYTLLRGDSRQQIKLSPKVDLAVFSPPYPNSFDYTDIYNVELWMLGYLHSSSESQMLRRSTLTSHVSISRPRPTKPDGSKTLNKVSSSLSKISKDLWSPKIPEMIDGYFSDMQDILSGLERKLRSQGEIWSVVGDSLYSGIHVPVAKILEELAPSVGLEVIGTEAFRSMRASAQQGGKPQLAESLVVFRKID